MDAIGITGSPLTGDAVLSLLAILKDPVSFQQNLDAMNAAIAENQRYIEAIGPADQIVQLREVASKDRDYAAAVLTAARAEADQIVNDASARASGITTAAQDASNKMQAEANAMMTDALTEAAKSRSDAEQIDAMKAYLQSATDLLNGKISDANTAIVSATEAKSAADAERQSIIEKHEQFIAGL